MLKINIVCVGTLKEDYWTKAIQEYTKRISRFATINIIEVAEKDTIEKEGELLLSKIKGYAIALDKDGSLISSENLAEKLDKLLVQGKSEISFIIGGSDGLSPKVKGSSNEMISFGKVTYPHQLMRVILAEQIYRALTINNHITYHK